MLGPRFEVYDFGPQLWLRGGKEYLYPGLQREREHKRK
jgi:hypothetical protein